jgi:hypothetical protein
MAGTLEQLHIDRSFQFGNRLRQTWQGNEKPARNLMIMCPKWSSGIRAALSA